MTDEAAPTASADDALAPAPPHPSTEGAAHDGGSHEGGSHDGGAAPNPPAEGSGRDGGAAPNPPAEGSGRDGGAAPNPPAEGSGRDGGAAPNVAGSAATAPKWRPNYVFLGVVSFVTLALDLGSKGWAKGRLDDAARSFNDRRIEVVKDTFSFMFARNRGGAWGLLQDEPESIRRPFFLGISALAIAFIVSLYRKLTPQQWALKWGLPLVLGGALGNLINRVQYNYVVDFIDIRAGWIRKLNGMLSDNPTDHWPTFNVADIAIVAGVLLMAVDMFTPRKSPSLSLGDTPKPPGPLGDTPKPPGETLASTPPPEPPAPSASVSTDIAAPAPPPAPEET